MFNLIFIREVLLVLHPHSSCVVYVSVLNIQLMSPQHTLYVFEHRSIDVNIIVHFSVSICLTM